MPPRKTAIARPEVTRELREAVRTRRDADVTRRLNELFVDPDVIRERAETASEQDAAGERWNDESW
jgi:hypothetical protein